MGNLVSKGVSEVMTTVLLIVFSALVLGTILVNSVFTSITIINVTELTTNFGLFLTAIVGFIALIGTVLGIVWLIKYVREVFDKKKGIGAISA